VFRHHETCRAPRRCLTHHLHEVDGRRGTIRSSDLPEIPSGGFMKMALFQPSLPEPCRHLSMHTALQGCGSTGLGLLRSPPHPLGSVRPPLHPFPLS
jgi:hypothetical protein